MIVSILRIILAAILCYIAGRWMGELTGGLTHNEWFQVKIIGILLLGAGLLLPAP